MIVDLFAGGGGTSLGIEMALGRSPDVAVNHSAEALRMHEENHPNTRHLRGDVWDYAPREVTGGRSVELLHASPTCFPAGTMILTRDGYRAIEGVAVGDEVLTHAGQWRRVTDTMRSRRPVVSVRGHGHPSFAASSEHPILARKRANVWDNAKRRYRRVLGPREWVETGKLEKGYYWGSPRRFPEAEPPPIPVHNGRKIDVTEQLMWVAGRYVADGWVRLTPTRADVQICCGAKKVPALEAALSHWARSGARSKTGELPWAKNQMRTAVVFSAYSRGLAEWLFSNFGKYAARKQIPGWALGMSEGLRRALLDGYLSGDGHTSSAAAVPVVSAATVSRALAFGLKSLATSLGYSPTVYFSAQRNNVIEGRTVNTKPVWTIVWRSRRTEKHTQTFQDADIEWAPIRERSESSDESSEVFNISVEDDESYVADGIIVHNCTHFSQAKSGPLDRRAATKIRALAWVVTRWAKEVRPRVITLENVGAFEFWGPLTNEGKPCPKRRGLTFRRWVRALEGEGYRVAWRLLRACDYGAPTTRERLFVVARRDGLPIVWPSPTHGSAMWDRPFRTAAECIDWALPCPSVYGRKLSAATMARVDRGLRKFVLETPDPFVVDSSIPWLVHMSNGERPGQAPRIYDVQEPLRTVVAGGVKHALCRAFIAKHYGGNGTPGADLRQPLSTITTKDHHALVTVHGEPIADVGMRSLVPRELFRAQGFPDTWKIDMVNKTAQIRLVGNSVSPQVAAALIGANMGHAQEVAA